MEANRNIPIFKTPCQEEREERDLAIYNEYRSLMQVAGQSKTMAQRYLCKKYDIHSHGTIYTILKRVENRLNPQTT